LNVCLGAGIKGNVLDEKNESVAFASIFVSGTTIGTTTNESGYFTLALKPGTYNISVKSIGYTMQTKQITLGNEDVEINFTLKAEAIKIKEFTVSSDAEDPAYAVIRQAIKKRKFYKEQIEAFSCDVYIKGVQKLKKKPNRVMGMKVKMNVSWDTVSGIIYMSESVSKYNYKQPNKVREEMISSRVSGNNQAFSYNQASDMFFNFYENTMDVSGLGARGFISPISSNALLTYRYKLLGTFYDQGNLINKIEVIPKRKNDPAFAGIIYIMEDSWRIHSTNLYLTKDAQIQFVDTLNIEQVYLPVSSDVWMPFSNNYSFSFDVFGFKGGGNYIGINSNYKLNPGFDADFFTNQLLDINEGANKKDTAYWNKYRPVPLTAVEKRDYVWRDSINTIKQSKPYQDSVDRVNNKFKFGNLIGGYEYNNTYKKMAIKISSPATTLLFNTVQGLTLGTKVSYTRESENRKRKVYTGNLGYGFANQTWFGSAEFINRYRPKKFAQYTIGAGIAFVQYNPDAIGEAINTSYTLFDERNFMKLYKTDFLHLQHKSEIANGFYLTVNTDYAYRSAAVNHTNFTFIKKDNLAFTSNNPLEPINDATAFNAHHILKINPEVTIRFKQKYLNYPDFKYIVESKYPILKISYNLGYTFNSDKQVYFEVLKASLSQRISLKLFGEIEYDIAAGKSLLKKPYYFMDYMHFNGNQTLFSNLEPTNFMLLDYYKYSTNDYFLQAHAVYNLEGFILNKIPALKLLRLEEVISFHYLKNNLISNYAELGFGVQRLFIRLEFVTAYSSATKLNSGIRLRMGI
jgi:hypothetical protein